MGYAARVVGHETLRPGPCVTTARLTPSPLASSAMVA